ncbi:MAG: DUF6496 domain-containing protein [Acidobacteriia bacterium]|nr:DUF6496 domain-containing protein [Terriglobia bacterium]
MATKKGATKKSATRKSASKSKARAKVGKVMGEFKRGQLRSGGKAKVKNPKQAIAIGLSEARRAGANVPAKGKSAAKKKSAARRPAAKKKSAAKKSSARKRS